MLTALRSNVVITSESWTLMNQNAERHDRRTCDFDYVTLDTVDFSDSHLFC